MWNKIKSLFVEEVPSEIEELLKQIESASRGDVKHRHINGFSDEYRFGEYICQVVEADWGEIGSRTDRYYLKSTDPISARDNGPVELEFSQKMKKKVYFALKYKSY